MLDKNEEYGIRYDDGWAMYKIDFWFDQEKASWIRSETHCGHGQADFWTEPQKDEVYESEVIDELEAYDEED